MWKYILLGVLCLAIGTFGGFRFGEQTSATELTLCSQQAAQLEGYVEEQGEKIATYESDKSLYELQATNDAALIAKLRGFCGKPCEGVE